MSCVYVHTLPYNTNTSGQYCTTQKELGKYFIKQILKNTCHFETYLRLYYYFLMRLRSRLPDLIL